MLKPKASCQDLERDFCSNVSELGSVEVEADRALGTILWALEPEELCAWVNEALDEPSTCETVCPGMRTSRPGAALVLCRVHLLNSPRRRVWFIGGQQGIRGQRQLFQCLAGLLAGGAR